DPHHDVVASLLGVGFGLVALGLLVHARHGQLSLGVVLLHLLLHLKDLGLGVLAVGLDRLTIWPNLLRRRCSCGARRARLRLGLTRRRLLNDRSRRRHRLL